MFRLSFIYMDHRNEQTYPAVLGTWSTLKSWLSWKQNLTYTCAKLDYHSLPVEPGILWQWFLRSWFLGIPLLGVGVKWFSIRLSLTSSSNPPKRALSTLFCHLFANFTCFKVCRFSDRWQDVQLEWSQVCILSMIFTIYCYCTLPGKTIENHTIFTYRIFFSLFIITFIVYDSVS